MKRFVERSKEIEDYLLDVRRYLHMHPELDLDLPITTRYVKEQLNNIGCIVEEVGESCIVATVGGIKPGKTVLLRADMDALPMEEDSGLDFSSIHHGKAHTCGHDIHTTFLIGAAKMLKEREDEIYGTIKLMFQPGEETLKGAKEMIRAGVLKHPDVDMAVGIHVQPLLPLGQLNFPKGAFLSSSDILEINIEGESCHSSQPHMGVDPINVAAHTILALQSLQIKEVPNTESVVLNICEVKAGNSSNIVPAKAVLRGTLRTYNKDLRNKIIDRSRKIIELTAESFSARSSLNIIDSCPPTINNEALVDEVSTYIPEMGIDFVSNPNYRLQVSDDFSFISEQIPSVFFVIGCNASKTQGNHNPKVVYNEAVISQGAALLSGVALKWLDNNK